MLALLGTSFTFLMTALGAATVFFFARKVCERAQGALLGFAAGVMMAASVWSLILPAIEQTEAEGRLPPFLPAAVGIVLGALTLFLLDELVRRRGGGEVHSDFLLLSAITLHNIPEGMAVGVVFAGALSGETVIPAAAAFTPPEPFQGKTALRRKPAKAGQVQWPGGGVSSAVAGMSSGVSVSSSTG